MNTLSIELKSSLEIQLLEFKKCLKINLNKKHVFQKTNYFLKNQFFQKVKLFLNKSKLKKIKRMLFS